MKFCFVLFCSLSLVLISQPKPAKTSEKNDPAAAKILNGLKSKFDNLSGYKFSYQLSTTSADNKTTSTTGNYFGSKSKFVLETPELKIVNNGVLQWNINIEEKEIQIHKITTTKKKKIETPMSIINDYASLFKYRVKDPAVNKKIILELIPLNKNNSIFKIDLTVDLSKNQIHSSKIYDRGGSRSTYTISGMQENVKTVATDFTVDVKKYAGYEVLDMQ